MLIFLDKNTDYETTLRLIYESPELKDKTIILFCRVNHLSTKPNEIMNIHFKPSQNELKEEKIFNELCLKYELKKYINSML